MNEPTTHSGFARALSKLITEGGPIPGSQFNELALELFGLQFQHNPAYKRICEAMGRGPEEVEHWTQIPFVPTAAFKELELTSLAPDERTTVFHSSGTTQQRPSRHFHSAESLALYEASLWAWFQPHLLAEHPSPGLRPPSPLVRRGERAGRGVSALSSPSQAGAPWGSIRMLSLTPTPSAAPHSSLAHMMGVVADKLDIDESAFLGTVHPSGWQVNLAHACDLLKRAGEVDRSWLVMGTAFQFVELSDYCEANGLRFALPAGSRVMETGGYKGRTRELSKVELHRRISDCLGIDSVQIVCEYGMSELSSQAYDSEFTIYDIRFTKSERVFLLPPWARVRVISPETGHEVSDGESGLVQVFDLANVWSVAAIQTEDLAVRRGDGFELLGRATLAEARGCSLMSV